MTVRFIPSFLRRSRRQWAVGRHRRDSREVDSIAGARAARPGRSRSDCLLPTAYCLLPAAYCRLDPGPENLGHAPPLRDAAARGEGGLGVEDLADRAQGGLAQMGTEAFEEMPRA